MLVLDISGKLDKKVTISKKFGIVLSNLPLDWKEEFSMHDIEIIVMRFNNYRNTKMPLLNKYTPQGTCETDYCEKFFDFLQYIVPDVDYTIAPFGTRQLGTNDLFSLLDINYEDSLRLINHISKSKDQKKKAIETLTHYGKLIDDYIESDNDFLQLDFLINALGVKDKYTMFSIINRFSILECLLLANDKEQLDNKLKLLFPNDTRLDELRLFVRYAIKLHMAISMK